MFEIKKDIIQSAFVNKECDAMCVTTNGIVKANGLLVMGKGIANDVALKFPEVQKRWGVEVKASGSKVRLAVADGFNIVAFPTKHNWKDDSDINLILKSAEQLVELTNEMGWSKVYLPRPGCGNGGLSWDRVKPMLELFLDGRFFVCSK